MLELSGKTFNCCDGLARRDFIRVGSMGLGALTLPHILTHRAQAAQAGGLVRKTSVIFLELAGGPTQFETYDPKPDSPAEYRGPFGAIKTNVPGVQFSELMAEQAKVMDKLAIIRSVHHERSSHDPSSHLTQTGYYKFGRKGSANEMPCTGAVAAKMRGANAPGIPAYVAVPRVMRNGGPAYLGNAFLPFETGGDPNRENFQVKNLTPDKRLTLGRLEDRRELLASIDALRRMADLHGNARAMDKFTLQAFELVTGKRARQAFDITAEDEKLRDRYGRTTFGQSMLLARRLVEAGVTFVTVRIGGWDDHNQIEKRMREKGPAYDKGVAALIADLYQRGLDKEVLVVAMGEFGRTPRVNRNAGRDHWGAVMSVLMAGGGLAVGQVVGSSSKYGETPKDAPYRPEDVLAIVYWHLGIDPETTLLDFSGRPRYLLERGELIREMI